jgi:RimJ/RimL family protein N-acetyltransferase
MKSICLTTPRLKIREYGLDDFQGVHGYSSDEETVKFMTWGPNTPEETRNFIDLAISQQSVNPRINFHFVIHLQDRNRIIGGCGIHLIAPDYRMAAIGYCINKTFWGLGFATESVVTLLHFGFDKQNLHRIIGTCDTRNVGSARVMEKNGMRQEARYIKNIWQKGGWRDSYLYAILSSEWKDKQT